MISRDAPVGMLKGVPSPAPYGRPLGSRAEGISPDGTPSPRPSLGLGRQSIFSACLSLLTLVPRAASLEKEVAGLREKIHHLDDMLKSQQRKVRQMIEQVRPLLYSGYPRKAPP